LERQQILMLFAPATRFEENESDEESEAAGDDWRRTRRRTKRNPREQFVSKNKPFAKVFNTIAILPTGYVMSVYESCDTSDAYCPGSLMHFRCEMR
jgi:hypothetical protein